MKNFRKCLRRVALKKWKEYMIADAIEEFGAN